MPIYEIDIVGRVVVKAYNVAQAKKQAMKYRIIGSSYGLSGGKHDRDFVPYERQHATLQVGKIRKIKP